MRNLVLNWIALSVALVIASCSSSDDDPADARRRCEALRDHVIDLRFPTSAVPSSAPVIEVTKPGAEPRPAAEPFDVAPHRAAMKQALGDHFIDACAAKMSITQINCALAAKDQASADACSPSPSPPAPPRAAQTASK